MRQAKNDICRRLVGGLLVNTADPEYRWFAETYHRVLNEVQPVGKVMHLVRYSCRQTHFIGALVERMQDIPVGMVVWELCDESWTIRRASEEIVWQAPLNWQWRTASEAGRWIGEFSARCPEEWDGGIQQFQLTTNMYCSPGEACDDAISLVDADPSWPRQYTEFAAWLREALGPDVALRIEHYGSTAIPGIPAKPIVDVLVEVPSFDIARRQVLPLLNREEWEYCWFADHMIFIKRQALMGRRTHHLHLAPAGHRIWEGLAFRDYLCAHPEEAARYAALKRELAAHYQEDREGYTAAKTAFVREITGKALP